MGRNYRVFLYEKYFGKTGDKPFSSVFGGKTIYRYPNGTGGHRNRITKDGGGVGVILTRFPKFPEGEPQYSMGQRPMYRMHKDTQFPEGE